MNHIDNVNARIEALLAKYAEHKQEAEYVEDSDDEKMYQVGDMVSFTYEGQDWKGAIEYADDEEQMYTVRVYAEANGRFEPTDMVYNVRADSGIMLYAQAETMYMKGSFVKFETLAGTTLGMVLSTDKDKGTVTVEVIDEYKGENTYTGIEVTHPAQAFVPCDPVEAKNRDQVILAKLKEFKMDVTTSESGEQIGVIEGYASTYGNTDLGGDIVKKGAFTQTLMHKGGKTLLLFDHGYKTTDIAGVAYYSDDERGLRMKGELPLSNPSIKASYDAIKFVADRGVPMGLSIGYNTIKKNQLSDGRRELLEVSLEETSITPFPMNTEARIMSAKTKRLIFASKSLLWNELKNDAPNEGSQQEEDGNESLLLELKTTINSMLKT